MKENKTIWNGYPMIGDTKELDFILTSAGFINIEMDDIISSLSLAENNYVTSGHATTLSAAFTSAVGKLPTTLNKAKSLLIQFVYGDKQVEMAELSSVTEKLNEVSSEMSLRWGIAADSSLDEDFKVIILLSE